MRHCRATQDCSTLPLCWAARCLPAAARSRGGLRHPYAGAGRGNSVARRRRRSRGCR